MWIVDYRKLCQFTSESIDCISLLKPATKGIILALSSNWKVNKKQN